ncbi:MAG: S9 family peptidase [Acidobacteria bacterium]|nr:S9 family peptidase [Acidobacteriota bacterium]
MYRVLGALALLSFAASAQKQPLTVNQMMKLARISDPQLSPDAQTVLFTVQTVDLERNSKPRQIYSIPVAGGSPHAITSQGNNERPRWMPDGKRVVFISSRGGSTQVWSMNPDGGEPKQLTDIPTEAGGVLVSPDAKYLVFQSSVYPECSLSGAYDADCNKKAIEAEGKSKVKARVYTSLLYRHWTEYQSQRRQHLLSMPLEGGPVKDLTPGNRDAPPFSLGGEDYAISPESNEVCYALNADTDLATSTNSDLYAVPIGGGESKKLTTNLAADNGPVYSPDGKYLAYRAQSRPGYESDRWRLVLLERATGKLNILTESLDRSVGSIVWSPDSKRVFFVSEDRGRHQLQMMPAAGGGQRIIVNGAVSVDDVQFSKDSKILIYTEQSGKAPAEIMKASSSGGPPQALTHLNDAVLADAGLQPLEEISVEGAEGAKVAAFVVKPPQFAADRKYPVLFLIHGGPQGAWGETWSYRWNPQVFAAAGYVVVMPNPRGSTGYGQKFTDEINADWGGRAFDDILAVVDHVAKQPWADPGRFAAAGGSYGGYMVNWLLGHTDKFRAFVSHAGVFDLRSMAGETEELWFPLWEFKGMPWQNPELYAKWSPSYFVDNFKTPTLVIHGEIDYRVPVGQGMQLFTSLQMQKVPSKLLLFPDEGHWVLKPLNSVLWYNSFLDWIGEWTKPAPPAAGGTDAK